VDGRILNSCHTGGFTGAFLGLYATAPQPPSSSCDFDWFAYGPADAEASGAAGEAVAYG
jgi:alpha-N-arabinofuranosidase